MRSFDFISEISHLIRLANIEFCWSVECWPLLGYYKHPLVYSVIQKDGLNFVRLYFLNYTWYVDDLHNI